MLKRRAFLTYFGLGCFASCFPIALAACTPKAITEESVAEKNQSTAGFKPIGTVAALDKAGQIQTKQVAIVRNPTNPKQLLAVSPKCTHQGCLIKWSADDKNYECPCHNSKFTADGKVLEGPASENLATYPAKIVGTQVLVKL